MLPIVRNKLESFPHLALPEEDPPVVPQQHLAGLHVGPDEGLLRAAQDVLAVDLLDYRLAGLEIFEFFCRLFYWVFFRVIIC